MQRWYAVQTRPRKERLAEQHLKNQGFATFTPLQRRARRIGSRTQWLLEPFFPGYIFVELDLEHQRWSPINGTIGVTRLVGHGRAGSARPAPLPDGLVERFRERSDRDGTMHFDERLEEGSHVRVVTGPLDGLCGILEKASAGERVTILLELLSGQTRVTLDRGYVTPA